jgi:hypothetical protein
MKKIFVRQIVFSKTPLINHYKFKDEFQIFPCDFKNVPVSKFQREFPLVLEYWYDEDEKIEISEDFQDLESINNFLSKNSKISNKANRLTRLLTAITNHRFFSTSDKYDTEGRWGIIFPEGEPTNETKLPPSSWSIPWFHYETISDDLKIKEFTEQKHSNITLIPHKEYFTYDPIDNYKKSINFPSTIHEILEIYFNLNTETKNTVDTVTHLISNGIDLRLKMKSLSFISFVSSIETLLNFHYNQQKKIKTANQGEPKAPNNCEKCGQPFFGIKAKYKEFLTTFVADSEASITKFNKIYNLRSSIVHSGGLLLGDEELNWQKSEKIDGQWLIHIETMQLARLSLVNWLIMSNKLNKVVGKQL